MVLAAAVDQVQQAIQQNATLDDQIETLDVHELAEKFEITFESFRKQITEVVGPSAVFKHGKKWVIRKQTYLEYLQMRERMPEE